MLSPSLALEQFTYVSRACERAPVRPYRPAATGVVVRDAAFYELVAEIREHEGQEVGSPMLFNVTVAIGAAMTALGAVMAVGQLL